VVGRIQRLFQSSNGREVMRHLRKEGDKMRQLNEQVALQQAKDARAATQIQKVARSVGVRAKYDYYKKGIAYGKSQNLKDIQKDKVKDMLEEATGKSMEIDSNTHQHILKYAQSLDPQQRDAYYRALEQVTDGGAQAMHPEPMGGFMGTVSTVHQDKTGRGLLNKPGVKVDLKTGSKTKKGDSRRATLLANYTPDYTQSDGETSEYVSQKMAKGKQLYKPPRAGERQSDRLKGVPAV